jgi:hypothetical protein
MYDRDLGVYASGGRPAGPTRKVSSLPILARRVAAVAEAARAGDEVVVRAELRELAAEASLLACAEPLPLPAAGVGRRQKVAGDRDALGV